MSHSSHIYLDHYIDEYGWSDGIAQYASKSPELTYEVSTELSQGHAAWKGFLCYRHRDAALVVERTFGTVALSLALDFSQVDAFIPDGSMRRATAARLGELGTENISLLERPPSVRQTYDVVAVSGLKADELTPELLDRLTASLRAHGSLYIAFESAMPDSVAGLCRPPLSKLVHRLRKSMGRVQRFWSMGTLCKPWELRPMGSSQHRWKHRLGAFVATRTNAVFGIAAASVHAGPSLFEEILTAAGPGLIPERYLFAHPVGFSIIARDPAARRKVIVRVPMDRFSEQRAEVNFEMVRTLSTEKLGLSVPVSLRRGEVHGVSYYVEQMISGTYVTEKDLRTDEVADRVIDAGASAITRIHLQSAAESELTSGVMDRIVRPILDSAADAALTPEQSSSYHSLRTWILTALSRRRLRLVFQHGDYTHDNMLLNAERSAVTGVFDWDLARQDGLPLLDLYYFLTALERVRTGNTYPAIFADRMLHGFTAREWSVIERYCKELNVPTSLTMPLYVLTWLHHIGVREYRPHSAGVMRGYWASLFEAAQKMLAVAHPEVAQVQTGGL